MEDYKWITQLVDQEELDELRKDLEEDGWIKFQEDGVFISKEACLLSIVSAIVKHQLLGKEFDLFYESLEHLETFLKICNPDNWE